METPGNQVNETVEKIETLTLSEQGVEAGDSEETQLTGVETGDAEKTHLTEVKPGDAEETAQSHDRGKDKHEQTSGASGGANNELQRKVLLPTPSQAKKDAKEVFEGVETGDAGETSLVGLLETKDAGETQQGHDCIKEELDQISGVSGSENNPLEEATDLVKLLATDCDAAAKLKQLPVKLAAYSEAGVTEDELIELWGGNLQSMVELIYSHVLFDQADSVMDVAKAIKKNNSQPPKPFKSPRLDVPGRSG